MSELGKLWFSLGLKDETEKDLKQIEKALQGKLKNEFKLTITPEVNTGKMEEAFKRVEQSVKNSNLANVFSSIERSIANTTSGLERMNSALNRASGSSNGSNSGGKSSTSDAENSLNRLKMVYQQLYANRDLIGIESFDKAVKLAKALRVELEEAKKQGSALSGTQTGSGLTVRLGEIRSQIKADRSAAREQERLNAIIKNNGKSFGLIGKLSGELGNQISAAFSIYSIERFLRSVVEIGGEFEKQKLALTSLIGDASKAEVIYSKIKTLSVESPFNFRDLVNYTKQLSAFAIPYEELYETTKRLADISAGVGVDMSRLILAYGQVRSAAFLRATELRQFTEAGVPMVEALANRFSMLEGKAIGSAEVFDRISKRLVSFEDVKNVLWDMTNAGGKFYDMQSVLSESLSGKVSNLRDAYEVMLSEIAKGNSGVLNDTVDLLRKLIENWERVSSVIGMVAGFYGLFKIVMIATNAVEAISIIQKHGLAQATQMAARALDRQTAATATLNTTTAKSVFGIRNLLQNLKSFGKASLWGAIIFVLGYIANHIYNIVKGSNRMEEALGDALSRASERASDATRKYEMLVHKLGTLTEGTSEYNEVLQQIQGQYGSYLGNINLEADAYEKLKGKIDNVTDALKRKAAEDLRAEGTQAIEQEYSKDINAAERDLKDELIDKGLGKASAGVLVASFRTKFKEGLNRNSTKQFYTLFDEIAHGYGLENIGSGSFYSELEKLAKLMEERYTAEQELALMIEKSFGKQAEPSKVGRIAMPEIDNWQKRVKDFIGDTKNLLSYKPKEDEDLATWLERVANNYKELEDQQKLLQASKGGLLFDADQMEQLKSQMSSLKTLTDKFNVLELASLDDKKQSGGNEDDPVAKQWEKRLELMQKAIALYEKWKEIIGEDRAESLVKDMNMFGDLFSNDATKDFLDDARKAKKNIVDALGDTGKQGELKLKLQLDIETEKADTTKKVQDLIREYETETERITREADEKIKALEEAKKVDGADTEAIDKAIARVQTEKAKELMRVQFEAFQQTPEYTRAFEDLKNTSTETLNFLIEKLREYQGEAAKSMNPSDLEVYNNAISQIENELDDRGNEWDAAGEAIAKYQKAKKALEKAEKEGASEEEIRKLKDEVQKAFNEMLKAITKVVTKTDEFMSMLKQVGDAIGGYAGDVIGYIYEVYNFVTTSIDAIKKTGKSSAEAMSTLEKASVILTIISAAIKAGQALVGIAQKANERAYGSYEKWAEKQKEVNLLTDSVNAYKLAVMEANEAEKSWFADNGLSTLRFDMEQMLEVEKQYFQKLNEEQAKYQDKKGGRSILGTLGATLAGGLFWDTVLGTNTTGINVKYGREITTLQDNLRFRTQSAKKGGLFKKGRNEKTVDLREWVKDNLGIDLFDEEGWINVSAAEILLENYSGKLAGDTEESLKALVELKETYDEYIESLREYVNEMFSPLVDNMVDSLWEWYDEGTDALTSFKEFAADTFREIANESLRTLIMKNIFSGVEDQLQAIYEKYAKGETNEDGLAKDTSDIMKGVIQTYQNNLPGLQAALQAYGDELKKAGIDIRGDESSDSSLSSGIQRITEDQADLLSSYVNAIRADASVNRKLLERYVNELYPTTNVIAEAQLTQLTQIQLNTAANVQVLTDFRDLFRRVTTPGSGVRLNV